MSGGGGGGGGNVRGDVVELRGARSHEEPAGAGARGARGRGRGLGGLIAVSFCRRRRALCMRRAAGGGFHERNYRIRPPCCRDLCDPRQLTTININPSRDDRDDRRTTAAGRRADNSYYLSMHIKF